MEKQLERLKERIPYDKDTYDSEEEYEAYLTTLLEDTEDIALNHLYPFLVKRPALPVRYYGWQLRACCEINEVAGLNGLKSYSENGLAFSKATDGMLSQAILNELIPYAGIPEKTEEVVGDDKG